MFGLIAPQQPDLGYRSMYSRCCQIQRRFFGLVSLPWLNYDAVFLYSCGLDVGVVAEFEMPVQRCCRLNRLPSLFHLPDRDLGRFAGAVSLLFAEAKLRDDLRDGYGRLARIGLFALRVSITRAWEYFDSIDPTFLSLIGRLTAEQVALERGSPALEEFVSPTARAVSAAARLIPTPPHQLPVQEAMAQIGYHLGAAIVAADCAADWKTDLAQKQFNPVTTEEKAAVAAEMAADHVERLGSIALDVFGVGARSTQLAAGVAARLRNSCHGSAVALNPPESPLTNSPPRTLDGCVRFADAVSRAASCGRRKTAAETKRSPGACSGAFQCCSKAVGCLLMLGECARDHSDE